MTIISFAGERQRRLSWVATRFGSYFLPFFQIEAVEISDESFFLPLVDGLQISKAQSPSVSRSCRLFILPFPVLVNPIGYRRYAKCHYPRNRQGYPSVPEWEFRNRKGVWMISRGRSLTETELVWPGPLAPAQANLPSAQQFQARIGKSSTAPPLSVSTGAPGRPLFRPSLQPRPFPVYLLTLIHSLLPSPRCLPFQSPPPSIFFGFELRCVQPTHIHYLQGRKEKENKDVVRLHLFPPSRAFSLSSPSCHVANHSQHQGLSS